MSLGPTGQPVTVPAKAQRPRPGGLARIRLENLLLGQDTSATVLVVAPPGAGKTTLLGRVAAASGSAAWYTTEHGDDTEESLVAYLALGLVGEHRERLPPAAGVDTLLAALGDEGRREQQLLVIDDLHEIAGTPAEHALERFLLLRPPWLRVLLGTRRPPTFNTARMQASGDLIELSGDDLRFRSWEVEDLFRTVYQSPLPPEMAALLCRRVGGLAAALQLFHLSARTLTPVERDAEVVRLNGRSRLIRSYLTRTVLDGLTPERRTFLVRTSPLGVLNAALCDALLGRSDSAGVLAALEAEQLFTTSPDGGKTYRYHQVLRDHLEVTLEDELPEAEVTALQSRAALLLEQAGHHSEALRAYKRAGDWGAAARLVRHRAGIADPDGAEGEGGDLSLAERDDPWLAVARIRRLLRQGSIDDALLALRLVEATADDPDLVALCTKERLEASSWLGTRTTTGDAHSPLGAIRALTRTVLHPDIPAAVPDSREAAGWALVPTIAALLTGQFEEARGELERAYPTLQDAGWPRLATGMLGALIDVRSPGQRATCCALLEDLSLTADVEGYPWLARVAQGLQSSLVLETAGQLWRIDACLSAVSACRRDGDTWGEFVVGALTGVALARQREYAEARLHLDRSLTLARALDAPVLELWVHALLLGLPRQELPVARGQGTSPPGRPRGLAGSAAARERAIAMLARQVGIQDPTMIVEICRSAVARPRDQPAGGLRQPAGGLGQPAGGPGQPAGQPGQPTASRAVGAGGQTQLQCLGGLRLVHGAEVDLTPLRPQARTLLMLLAIRHGADVHRERLIDVLWPNVSVEAATHRLQVAISSIRRLLEGHGFAGTAVRRQGEAYRLLLPGVRSDVQLLEAGITDLRRLTRDAEPVLLADRSAELAQLYRGDLLPEVGESDWVLDERDRLRLSLAGALADSALACLSQGRPDLALWQARQVIELDPLRDTAWSVLARIQQELGDGTAAQVTRAEHARVQALLNGDDEVTDDVADDEAADPVADGDPAPAARC